MLNKLRAQDARLRRKKSRRIAEKLFSHAAFLRAKTVCFYVSLPSEVDTHPMIDRAIRMGKRVVAPLSDLENKELKLFEIKDRRKDLTKGRFGIWEPRADRKRRVSPKTLDWVIVPGVAFDRRKNRLGRGLGFYDRFLSRLTPRAVRAGLAFSFQIISRLPVERHDKTMHLIVTER